MGIKNSHSKDNSKNNNNCLAVFFGIIHLDDELKPKKPKKDKQDSKKNNRQKKEAGLSVLPPICWVCPSKRAPVVSQTLLLQVAQWIAVLNLNLLRYCLLISVQQVRLQSKH